MCPCEAAGKTVRLVKTLLAVLFLCVPRVSQHVVLGRISLWFLKFLASFSCFSRISWFSLHTGSPARSAHWELGTVVSAANETLNCGVAARHSYGEAPTGNWELKASLASALATSHQPLRRTGGTKKDVWASRRPFLRFIQPRLGFKEFG